MVPILVLLSFVVLIGVDWYLIRRAAKVRALALGVVPAEKLDRFFHPGHSWLSMIPGGLVRVGASDFAANFAGDLSTIELPRKGRSLRQGEPAWTMVSNRNRRLTQVMPLAGRIVAVNEKLLDDPDRVRRSPYGSGWILCVRPRRLSVGLKNLLHKAAAETWLDSVRSAVATRLSPTLGRLAHDGGEWVAGFGDLLEDARWEDLRTAFFPEAGE